MRFFLGALLALSVFFSGTAFADLAYINNDDKLVYVNSQGIEQVTDIEANSVLAFNRSGSPRILVTSRTESDIVSIYDPNNFSSPIASTDLFPDSWNYFEPHSIVEFGSNIVVEHNGGLIEINPDTCKLINSSETKVDTVHVYKGQLVGFLLKTTGSDGSMYYGISVPVTMDTISHVSKTAHFANSNEDFSIDGDLEVSGGELYFALGSGAQYMTEEEEMYHGLYRVSKVVDNMEVNRAELLTSDIPSKMATSSSRQTPRIMKMRSSLVRQLLLSSRRK